MWLRDILFQQLWRELRTFLVFDPTTRGDLYKSFHNETWRVDRTSKNIVQCFNNCVDREQSFIFL